LNDLENTLPTHHEKIMIAKVRENDFELVKNELQVLSRGLESNDNIHVVRQMKEMIPEFKSQNSIYEQLDKEKLTTINPQTP
ncbi:MAG: polysaccharide biosynthesis protein, partial [Sphingobacteriaceae bacterium]